MWPIPYWCKQCVYNQLCGHLKKYASGLANLLFFRMFGDLPAFRAFTAAFGTFYSHTQPFKTMRVVVDPQFKLGQVPIDQIKFHPAIIPLRYLTALEIPTAA